LAGSLPFAAIIAIVGLGQMLVVQQGGFDLSLAVVITTHMSSGNDDMLFSAMAFAFGCALVAGLANGILVGVLRLNAIVATIGMNALLYGAVFAVSGGVPRITTPLMAEIAGGKVLGIPNSVLFAGAILLVVSFVLKHTVVGRRFEAIGANPAAAHAAGLRVRPYQAMAYVFAQLHYCVAGILIFGITREPTAFQGDSLLLPSVAVVVLAGTTALAETPSWCGPNEASLALLGGFGGNSWRLVTTASGAEEAAKCPSITQYEYADGQGNTQKAISDINLMAARGIKAMVVFGDAGPAVLPALTNAHKAGTIVVP
jgi:ribose/xylose/arabinose/galactoside ABC-type transport system permease subunit